MVVLAGAWVGWRGLQAKHELEAAQTGVSQVRHDLAAGRVARARQAASDLRSHASRARSLTHGPLWRAAAAVPYAGDNLEAVAGVADVADTLASRAVPRMLDAGQSFDPKTLRPAGDRIAVGQIAQARPAIRDTSAMLGTARRRVRALGRLHLVGPVAAGVADLGDTLVSAQQIASDASTAADLLPSMLGAHGTRRYLLAFQNPDEARGTGGIIGAYGVLEVRHGKVRLVHLGSDGELRSMNHLPVDLGPEFRRRYGSDPAIWSNSNMSPHFPYAARIWLALWRHQTGQRLDGVIATDPVALGYVLDATGSVTLPDGTVVTGQDAATFTLHDIYARYPRSTPAQNVARDAYLQQVAKGAFSKLLSGAGSVHGLLDAVTRAAGERRLLVYSTHDGEQHRLASTVLGGTLSSAKGPHIAVAVNNESGSKLDYYLDRTVDYTRLPCTDKGGMRRSRVAVTLSSTAPDHGLPQYVRIRADAAGRADRRLEAHDRLRVSVFLPVGARLQAATLDGQSTELWLGRERDRPTLDVTLELAPGGTHRLVFYLDEPPTPGRPTVRRQPLVRPMTVKTSTPRTAAADCSA